MSGYKIKRLGSKPRRASTAHSYFSFGTPSVTPVPLPPLPRWMLDTPMHSKLPMVPAPKGMIVLHTTGLGEKLHHTLSDLDFDPNPQGLSLAYSSLHDKHLKTHYSNPSMVARLIRNGFITPEGKVICSLKEFNDYQQHLKRVRLEKQTQDRKRRTQDDQDEKERLRWNRPKTSNQKERQKRAEETKERKKRLDTEQRTKLVKTQKGRELKRLQLLEEKRRTQRAKDVIKEKEQERVRLHRQQLAQEEKRKKTSYLRKRAEEERSRAIKLDTRRQMKKEARENELEQNWERKLVFQELREIEEQLKKHHEEEEMDANIDARDIVAESQRLQQKGTFDRIREARAKQKSEKEQKISRHLEGKRKQINEKFELKRQKIAAKFKNSGVSGSTSRRHSNISFRHSTRTSSWEISECLLADISTNEEPGTISSQELPVVSPPGVCRKVSWHESMSELSSKGRLPPIGSRFFSEEDEEMYTPDSPDLTTSEESTESKISSDSRYTRDVAEPIDICLPAIEIQLEEAEQCRSLEFTRDEIGHFMEMGSHENLDAAQTVTPIGTQDSVQPNMDPSTDPAEPQADNDKPTKPVDVAKSVVSSVIIKAISSLFQCAGSSDTISLTSEYNCQSRLDTPNNDSVDESEDISYETSDSYVGLDGRTPDLAARTPDGYLASETGGGAEVTDGTPEGADSVLTGVIDDNSVTSFGVTPGEQTDMKRLSSTTKACMVVRDAMSSALSSVDGSSSLGKSASSRDVEFSSPVSISRVTVDDGSSDDEHFVDAAFAEEMPRSHFDSDDTLLPPPTEEVDDINDNGAKNAGNIDDEYSGYSLDQRSTLLQSVIDVFGNASDSAIPVGGVRSASGEDIEDYDSDFDEDEDDDCEVIGFLENPNVAEETATSLVAETMGSKGEDELADIVSKSNDSRAVVEGAMRRASSGDFFTHKGSITEAVLSIENVSKSASSKRLMREKVSGKYSSDGDNDVLKKPSFEPEDHYHQIIPLYHNHVVDVGEELIDRNLSAISVKPDSHNTTSQAHSTGNRNSFRNIFRPDLTYCEGSAKTLKTTLIRQLSQSSASSGGSSHAQMMHLLDQSHHDVTAHHSNEEIVHTDDAEGVCQWPKSRAFKVHHVVDDVVTEQDEPTEESCETNAMNGQLSGDKIRKVDKQTDQADATQKPSDTAEDRQSSESGNRGSDITADLKNPKVVPKTSSKTQSNQGIEHPKSLPDDIAAAKVTSPDVGPDDIQPEKLATNGMSDQSGQKDHEETDHQDADPETNQEPVDTSGETDVANLTDEEPSNINTNRKRLSIMSITSCRQSSGTSSDGVLIKVSETRSSFVATTPPQQDSDAIDDETAKDDTVEVGHGFVNTDEVFYIKDESSQKQETCGEKKTHVRIQQAESDTNGTLSHQHLNRNSKRSPTVKQKQSCNAQSQKSPKAKPKSSLNSQSRKSPKVKPKSSSNVQSHYEREVSRGPSGAEANIIRSSKVSVTTTLHVPSKAKCINISVKKKDKKKKAHTTRILSASKSLMAGSKRPSTAKLRHISQSRSANSPSHAKREVDACAQAKGGAEAYLQDDRSADVRLQTARGAEAQSQDDKSPNAPSRSEIASTSPRGCEESNEHQIRKDFVTSPDSSVCERVSSFNVTTIRGSSSIDKNRSDTAQERSLIFVQPVKQKRSSCTVIMPGSKRSSLLNPNASGTDEQ